MAVRWRPLAPIRRCTDSGADNQGMFGQILTMTAFTNRLEPYYGGSSGTEQGLLTAILELGAWVGVLFNVSNPRAHGRRSSRLARR